MKIEEAVVGTRVRSNIDFACVPAGTPGIITEDYGTGVMVEWQMESNFKPLSDGFDKETELHFLDLCRPNPTPPSATP